jgi:SanA protein
VNRWSRWAWRAAIGGAVSGVALVTTANVVVLTRTGDRIAEDAADLDRAQVAIVPGSMVRPDGTLGRVVAERLDAAVALYEAGLVDKLLVSGDNGSDHYDEPDAMRDAALAAGVAPEDVFTDYAGFNTWHTMRRAAEVFEVDTAVVVTQDFHVARAVDLGRAAGIDVQGYVAGDAGRGGREVLARVRGLGETIVKPEVTGGPSIPITGDGRDSWAEA